MGLGGQIKTGAWDPEEDDLLYYWQSKVGNKWSEVAKHIPGRTGQQCAQRWRHKVNPNIRRDKWTEDEDAKLIELVKTFGVGRWAEIARNCDGRTDQQCMGRWRRHLDPAIRRDSWSPEEDAKLRQLHGQYGTSWSRISKNLKGRTSQQCRARWHQINNTRSKSCGSGGAGTPAAAAAGGGRQLAGRKASTTKRKNSRRRQDSSCSEDEEDEEEDFYDDEDELLDGADEHAGSSGAHSGSGSQQGSQPVEPADEQQQDYAAAVAAAAAAAGYGYGAAELQQPWVASLAAGMIHGALSTAADPAAQAAAEGYDVQQQRQQDSFSSQDEHANSGDEADADADDAAEHDSRHGGRSRADMQPAPPVSRFKSLPSKLGPGAAAPAAGRSRLKHTSSMPAHRRTPSGPCMSPGLWSGHQQQQQLNGTWSPSRLLLSPQRPEDLGRGGRGSAVACADVGRDVNDEEAAGAETLLEMASLLRQESCELQPAQLPLPAYTPPKRPAGDRLGDDLPDGFSPSPYKRARSSRLFADEEDDVDLKPADNGRSMSQRRGAKQQQQQSRLAGDDGLFGDGPTPQGSPAAAHGHHRRNGSIRHYRVPTNKAAAAADDRDEGLGAAAAAAGDACGFFGDRDYPGPHGFRGSGFGLHPEQGDEAGRPSNASSLTQMRDADAMAAAAAAAAAVFMSPPPPVRGSRLGVPGSATTTPNRPAAQHNALGILGSPMFERMVGCATPPSGGRTQPSAATLAALQSPQPSRVPEPFWTPFTGLFQDALFSRGTSATPDLPSGGKPRLPRGLFSPPQRSGSASGGKVAARRGMLRGGDVSSPLGGSAPDTDDANQMGSQPSGDSAERPSGAATDAETGPSPAAACGVVPPVGHVHHRVVRRLDQHEAWGATRASPSKPPLAGDTSVKREALAGSGTGFSLFSPVKKQRVPLFNETSSIKVGATPSKPDVQDAEQLLPIAPLKHNLPEQACSSLEQQQQQGSPPDRLAPAAAASNILHRRSPLGAQAPHDQAAASNEAQQLPHAATAATAEQHGQQRRHGAGHRPQQQQQAEGGGSFRDHEDDQQHQVEPEQRAHADGAAADAAEGQGQQQHPAAADAEEGQGVSGSPGLMERAGSINHQPVAYGEPPDTPVNARMDTADNTSCSGTPNTPAAMRTDATGGAGHQASPSEYVTPPQHRLRALRPLAPLHKDCLIAAATRSLADGLAAQQARHERQQASASAAASRAAAAAAGAAAAAPAAEEDSPGQCSGDSSRILSCERLMDSPLEAAGMTHSPSQWHQGMVAMLRSLQQTPLQPKGLAGAQGGAGGGTPGDTPGAVGAAASSPAASAPGSGMGIKVCSRALRRLQDELERGSAATAAAAAALLAKQQQQQRRHVKTEPRVSHHQQQQAGSKDGDAQVPFSAGLSMAPAMSAAAAAGASCSTPMMLPLFTTPATAPGSSRLPAKGGPGAAAVRNSTTPLALAPQCSSGVASVSLTPAVVTMHTPAGSAAASTVTPRMPAIAWPVQQRSDGGLVVSAAMTAGPAAAGAGAGPYATSGALVQLTPAASSTKAASAGTGATPFPPAAGAAAAVQQWPQVVNIQPLTLLATACNAAVAAGHAAALQSVLALQPSPAPSTGAAAAAGPAAVGGGLGQMRAAGVTAASTAGSSLRDSSHAVRSRLHALIDSV